MMRHASVDGWGVYQNALSTLKRNIANVLRPPEPAPQTLFGRVKPKKSRQDSHATPDQVGRAGAAQSCINFVALLELALPDKDTVNKVQSWEDNNLISSEQRLLPLIANVDAKLTMEEDSKLPRYVAGIMSSLPGYLENAGIVIDTSQLPPKVESVRKNMGLPELRARSLGKMRLGHRAERIYGITSDAWTR